MAASPTSAKPRSAAKAAIKPKAAAQKTRAAKASKKLSVQEQLSALEARLKRANTATRKNVKTLEQRVEALGTQTKSDHSAQKANFTKKVNALNKKLTTIMDSNRAAISEDLSAALSASHNEAETLNKLSAALERSDARIAHAEMSQSDAIRKVNRHLANLATALEARFDDETAARQAAITASEAKLKAQIDDNVAALNIVAADNAAEMKQKLGALEADMASALEGLGGKVETLAIEFENRQGRLDANMGDKVSEVALQTQTEFETFRDKMDTRLEDMSHQLAASREVEADTEQFDGQIHTLQERLNNLEAYLEGIKLQSPNPMQNGALQNGAMPNGAGQLNIPNLAAPLPTHTHNIQPQHASLHSQDFMPQEFLPQEPTNVVQMSDAFAPAMAQTQLAANPYAQMGGPNTEPNHPQPITAPIVEPETAPNISTNISAAQGHIPVEFDPNGYQNAADLPTLSTAMPSPIIAQAVTTPPPIIDRQPQLPPMGASGALSPDSLMPDALMPKPYTPGFSENSDNLTDNSSGLNNSYLEPALPYADPAYAENESPRAERIGEPLSSLTGPGPKAKDSLSKLPLKGSPLKFLLMGSAVALLAIFAMKGVLGGEDNYAPISDKAAAHSPADSGGQNLADLAPNASLDNQDNNFTIGDATQAPIGQYAENITPDISGAEKTSLESAAAQGNAIAQYQLGITHLKASENSPADLDKAVELIRAAAAQNLPPAQYRLAKLYEIGQGVQTDLTQAQQLTQRAANSGHRIAMHDLALYYMDGRGGVDIDVSLAEHWFEQAALHGVVDSQFNLAVLSESKKGDDRDIDTAYFWYNIAGKQGDQIAQKRVHTIFDGLSSEQVSAAQSRIAAFTPRPVNPEANGVFRDVPWQSDTSNQSVEIERIREVQNYLAELGYEVGTPDGAMGPRTRAAITEFEIANELPETGIVDDALIDKLELAVGA